MVWFLYFHILNWKSVDVYINNQRARYIHVLDILSHVVPVTKTVIKKRIDIMAEDVIVPAADHPPFSDFLLE